jgi:hypothetical protein
MTFTLAIGTANPWHVGPFVTAAAAQHWAETNGLNDWRLMEMEDPAEAPGILAAMRVAS